MNKKNKLLVAVLSLFVVVLILVTVFAVKPLLEESAEPEEVPVTQEGESIGLLGKYQIHKKLDRSQINRILLHNSHGEYAFVRDKSGEFVIEGLEELSYNSRYFSALVSIVGNPLAVVKVSDNDSGYEEYGLADSDTYWEVTTTDGEVHRITIGHKLHTAGGYYVSYSNTKTARKAVYVLGGAGSDIAQALEIQAEENDTSLDITVLKPVEFYVTPILIAGIDTNDFYTMNKLTVFKDDEIFVSSKIANKEDQINPDATVEYVFTHPAAYHANSENYTVILQQLAALVGESTVKAGATDEDIEKYGLADPKYKIAFVYKNTDFVVFVSELREDGSYFAYSNYNPGVIVKVNADSLSFLEEDLLYWISPQPFNHYITSIESISVSGKDTDLEFYLRHGLDENNKATLTVDAFNHLTEEKMTIAAEDKVWDFRSAFRTLLYAEFEDTVPLTDAEKEALLANRSNCLLTLEYTLKSGTKHTLEFRQYSTRRALLTIDGKGEFYVSIDRAAKILGDYNKVWRGETVDSHAKN